MQASPHPKREKSASQMGFLPPGGVRTRSFLGQPPSNLPLPQPKLFLMPAWGGGEHRLHLLEDPGAISPLPKPLGEARGEPGADFFLPSLPKIWLLAAGSLQSLCLLSCSSPLGEQRLGSAVSPRRFRFLAWKGLLRGAGGVGLLFLSAGELPGGGKKQLEEGKKRGETPSIPSPGGKMSDFPRFMAGMWFFSGVPRSAPTPVLSLKLCTTFYRHK